MISKHYAPFRILESHDSLFRKDFAKVRHFEIDKLEYVWLSNDYFAHVYGSPTAGARQHFLYECHTHNARFSNVGTRKQERAAEALAGALAQRTAPRP